jgi:hypothetical protein
LFQHTPEERKEGRKGKEEGGSPEERGRKEGRKEGEFRKKGRKEGEGRVAPRIRKHTHTHVLSDFVRFLFPDHGEPGRKKGRKEERKEVKEERQEGSEVKEGRK